LHARQGNIGGQTGKGLEIRSGDLIRSSDLVGKVWTAYTLLNEVTATGGRPPAGRGLWVDIQLEIGLKKAIEWIGQRRRDDPSAGLAALVDEACRRFDLNPIQADFLYRHFTQG